MDERHPDAPGGGTVDEELTEETRKSMDHLGQAEPDDGPDARSNDEDGPGQNSDRLPQ